MALPSAHGGRLLLVTVLVGMLAAAVLAAGNIARAQDPPTPTTHQITRGTTAAALTSSLNAVFASGGGTLAAVKAGDTIAFGPGEYEDIGRADSFYLKLNKANLTVRGARDPRFGEADGVCDPTKDTILTGSSAFSLTAANITVEHFCFQNIDDGSSAHATPHTLSTIRLEHTADGATVRRNRIDNTIGKGVAGHTDSLDDLTDITIAENEFIDIGLIETNGAGGSIQPRHTGQEPSAIQLDTFLDKEDLRIDDNLFDGSAWVAVSLYQVEGGTISGNTFRNMPKSAIFLISSPDFTLHNNTYEGNNRDAWRVVETADWMNDVWHGLSDAKSSFKIETMESEALQTLLLSNRAEAVAMGMDGDLYDAAVASSPDSVYRDPGLHAAVRIAASPRVTISNSTFTRNHNSIAICGDITCRVEGLEAVGDDDDTGRAPAYISPLTYEDGRDRVASTVTLSGNQFTDSDTRTFGGPGSVGNHLVIGYHRAHRRNQARGPAVGSFSYEAGNSFTGSGGFGGAAEPTTHQITHSDTDAALQTSLDAVFGSDGATLDAVKSGDTIEFGPGEYEDIGRASGLYLQLDKASLTVRGASDPRFGEADGECDPTTDTILKGSSAFSLTAANITLEHFCFQNIDDGSSAHATPHTLATIRLAHTADRATIRRNRINNTIGMGVDGRVSAGDLTEITIAENEFIEIGLIENNGAGTAIQPRHAVAEPSAIRLDTTRPKSDITIDDNLFEGSAWVGVSFDKVDGGTISGNIFRNMAKSAVYLGYSPDITLDNNTYEGNNRAAWRVVRTANWLNDVTFGISGASGGTKRATLESAALQDLMRMTKVQAEAVGMDGALYDAAVAAAANSVYRDPDLHAAVRVVGSAGVTISNSTFTNNHNSIAICGEVACRVDGLEEVGTVGDTGRAPAYISLTTFPGGTSRIQSSVTLSGNEFTDSDARSFEGPGSIGNHLVIGYFRAAVTSNAVGPAVGSFTHGAGNSYSGDGVFGGAVTSGWSGISIESESAEVAEGANAVFNLTIDPPAANDLSVRYRVSEDGSWVGTLPDGSPALPGTQITVAAGDASAVLTIPIVSDGNVEADGSITVTIEAGERYKEGATATVAVRDDTVSGISLESESAEVVEGAAAVFNLTIDPPAGNDLTVHYSVSEDGSWAGTLPDDSPALPGNQITVAAGDASAVLTIPTASDGAVEADGSITVTIAAGERYSDGATATVAVRDDTISAISITRESAEVVEGADIVFNLTIDPPAGNDLTVHYSVSEVGSWVGTLRDDNRALPGDQITVAAGDASAVLTVPTASDGAVEDAGSITVTIDAGERYSDGATATVNVLDGPIVVVAAPPPPPIFVPPPPPSRKDEVAVVDGAAKLEANKVTVDLVEGSLPENVETVETTVTKLTRSKTPQAPDSGRFRIAGGAVFDIALEATLADETSESLTELATPVTVCLPVPRTVSNPVVLRYDAETEEWVKLRPADSSEEGQVCAFADSFSVYAVANEADHLEGLSANQINDFSVWEADYTLTATELLSAIEADLLWVRSDEEWIGYATFEGEPIPGAIDFLIANGDTLWLGSVGSGEEDEG